MADIRSFRTYIEELSGNKLLIKKMAALERANKKLEHELSEIKAELKEIKVSGIASTPKKRGRKPRTMLQIIEAEMKKKPERKMKVTDMVKLLKQKKYQSKAQKMYPTVAASLNNSDLFVKSAPGEYQLVKESAPAKPKTKAPAKKKAVAKKAKPKAKKAAAKKK